MQRESSYYPLKTGTFLRIQLRSTFTFLGIFVACFFSVITDSSANDETKSKRKASSEKRRSVSEVQGILTIDITDIRGRYLDSTIRLDDQSSDKTLSIHVPDGMKDVKVNQGNYKAYISVYAQGVPYVVESRQITIQEGKTTYLLYELLEGASGQTPLSAFDQDRDLFIGRVELQENTDPDDATSVPGVVTLNWPDQLLSKESGWYHGELHAHSKHGIGRESVTQVIRRAQKLGLDFLAIMDRNTLAAPLDKKFNSKSVVLIPGLEWGSDENGVALVYGPRSMPSLPNSSPELSATIQLIQAQGGLVFAAHPCFPLGSWNWNVNTLNGIQTWCMGWRTIPGITLRQVHESNRARFTPEEDRSRDTNRLAIDGRFLHPLAKAANLPGLSSNGQSSVYWDYELNRGLRLTAIGGSQTGSPKVEMAEPVTYVYAYEKSLSGILDGMRQGRTYISKGLDGPTVEWIGDIFNDGSADVGIGGVVPLDQLTQYYCQIRGAKGKKLQILVNGSPMKSLLIDSNDWFHSYQRTPEAPVVYRLRIIGPPKNSEKGFGGTETFALTSPIYARGVMTDNSGLVKIENDYVSPESIDKFIQNLENSQQKRLN